MKSYKYIAKIMVLAIAVLFIMGIGTNGYAGIGSDIKNGTKKVYHKGKKAVKKVTHKGKKYVKKGNKIFHKGKNVGKSLGRGYARVGNTLYKEVKNQAKATGEGFILIGKTVYRLQQNVLRGYVAVGGEIFENGMLVGRIAGKGLIYIGETEYKIVKGTARTVGAGYIKIGNTVYKQVGKAGAGVAGAATGAGAHRHAKPDLKIDKIYLDRNCNVIVRVKNAGKGRVPKTVWTKHYPKSSSVYLKVNGKGWGGATIWKFDPRRRLQKPGGTAIYKSNLKVAKSARITATIDHTKQVAESNERNNRKTRSLKCKKRPVARVKPDLVVDKISLDTNCNVVVTIRNSGKGKLPNSVWTNKNPKSAGVYIYINGKNWGGATIWKFNPSKSLQNPGGTATYKSNLKINGKANIKAVIDMWNQVAESQEGNNAKIKTLACLKAAGKISAEAIRAEKSPTMTKTLPEGAIGISGQAQIKTVIPEIPVKRKQLDPGLGP
ncbi:MAG: hypothetical protein JRD71_11290 [Deltaproteobacteria bacterium]|nr:hypothetical protein [Deltaproteobacteria bacterium]